MLAVTANPMAQEDTSVHSNGGRHETVLARFDLAIVGFAAFIWLVPAPLPLLIPTVSQINVQDLMRNIHGLPDTTVLEPF